MLLINKTVSIYVSRPSHTPLKTSYIVTIQMTRERTSTYLKIDNLVWYDLHGTVLFRKLWHICTKWYPIKKCKFDRTHYLRNIQ